ncbi:MAG TPA: hypothetical protein VK509_10980, partial [Polyangiales bacterium]|nr:hypothetical protein [Polyangiales bacterium]
VERTRGGEPRKPTGRAAAMSGYGVSAATQEAADRSAGGPNTQVAPTLGDRCLSTPVKGVLARNMAEVESWLRDPARHSYGERVLVSTQVFRVTGSAPLRLQVRCTPCGRTDLVNARLWCLQSEKLGKTCVECGRARRRSPQKWTVEVVPVPAAVALPLLLPANAGASA